MPQFGSTSRARLETCHQDLQMIFNYVIKSFDCTIICGYRDKKAQNKAYDDGFSKVHFPNSKHNMSPSIAIDVIPWPIEWENTKRMKYFAGYVMGIAKVLGYELVSGLDWDDDTILKDTTFVDHPHFQLVI